MVLRYLVSGYRSPRTLSPYRFLLRKASGAFSAQEAIEIVRVGPLATNRQLKVYHLQEGFEARKLS
jgi:hypothetical protein